MTQIEMQFEPRHRHSARLQDSPRLQRILALLKLHYPDPISSRSIARNCDIIGLSAAISELRDPRVNNIPIICTQLGRGRYTYVLTPEWMIDNG